MFCAISGQAPEEPVVSLKSGHLFEKRLITKYIETEGKCPVTGQELSLSDILDVTSSKAVKPRPATATSVPGMLTLFQNEWDALMLETFTLKQHLETVRQELSHALYQHDAACRVIARLIKERDAARNLLSNAETQITDAASKRSGGAPAAAAASADAMQTDEPSVANGMAPAIVKKMEATSKDLQKSRKERFKKKILPPNLATPEDIAKFTTVAEQSLHKANQPGVLCIDLHSTNADLVLSGGADSTAVIYNRATKKVSATLTGHSKKVSAVQFHPTEDIVLTCSYDKTAKVWKPTDKGYHAEHTFTAHTGEVTGLDVHPTNEYFVTGSLDRTWCLHQIETGTTLTRVSEAAVLKGYSCLKFHPDGLILGTGTVDSFIRIWDIKLPSNVASFEGHKGAISAIAFSENGYHLATAADDNAVRLWDLRKLENFHTIPLDDGVKATSLHFDFSGQYLAVGGMDARVYSVKGWNLVKAWQDNTAPITAIKFGSDARHIATGSLDRHLRILA